MERLFKMQRGPMIPWATAEVIYRAYSALYPNSGKSLEKLHQRGGFGWSEVGVIFDELRRRKPQLYAELLKPLPAQPLEPKY